MKDKIRGSMDGFGVWYLFSTRKDFQRKEVSLWISNPYFQPNIISSRLEREFQRGHFHSSSQLVSVQLKYSFSFCFSLLSNKRGDFSLLSFLSYQTQLAQLGIVLPFLSHLSPRGDIGLIPSFSANIFSFEDSPHSQF